MGSKRELGLVGIIVLLMAVILRGGEVPSLGALRAKRSSAAGDEDVHHVCQHHLAQKTERTSQVYCPVQPEALALGSTWEPESDTAFRQLSYERLKGAIQIRTETFDDMTMNATDPSFNVFYDLERYLRETFPLFHEKLAFEKVNGHGLLFTWRGSKPDLKPVLLMAHQDVVPVNPSTWSQWTYPPFSGHLDEQGWVWGRGTTDMKGTLVALMASAEKLLSENFEPERTILFSHGFDEEIGGPRGAKELAQVILKRYGPEGISIIVDEGFTGVDVEYGTSFARVGVAEKGCFSVTLSVLTEGGHSSRPPTHTGVGIMSRLLVEMENNPNLPRLRAGNPLLTYLECAAQYGEDMDPDLKAKVRLEECWPSLADEFGKDRIMQTFLKTTQAIDIVNGGIKYNALPETVTSLTNYRIDLFETTQDTIDRLVRLLTPLADEMNMTFAVMNDHPEVKQNVIRLETFGIDLEPAPLTPAEGPAWELMGGTIKSQFPDTVVVPSAMTAFTDTRWYWDVSRHIYRFVPASLEHILNYHTVNERIHMDAHMSTIKFFHKFIQNTVGWDAP